MGFKVPVKAAAKYGKKPAPAPTPAPAPRVAAQPEPKPDRPTEPPEVVEADPDPIDPGPSPEEARRQAQMDAVAEMNRRRRAAQQAAQEAAAQERRDDQKTEQASAKDSLGLRDEQGRLPAVGRYEDGKRPDERRREIIERTIKARKGIPIPVPPGKFTEGGLKAGTLSLSDPFGVSGREFESQGGFVEAPRIPKAVIEDKAKRMLALKRARERRDAIAEEQKSIKRNIFGGVSNEDKALIEQLANLQRGGKAKFGIGSGTGVADRIVPDEFLGGYRLLPSRLSEMLKPGFRTEAGQPDPLLGVAPKRGDDPRLGEKSLIRLRKALGVDRAAPEETGEEPAESDRSGFLAFLERTLPFQARSPGRVPFMETGSISDADLETFFYGGEKVRRARLAELNKQSLAETNNPHPLQVLQDRIDATNQLRVLRGESDAISMITRELGQFVQDEREAAQARAKRAAEAAKGAAQKK